MTIEIADRLVKLRKKYGYSQEELADKLGLSRQAVSKWERAEASPDTDNLICLAKLYGVSLDELLATDDDVETIIEEQVKEESETKKENNDDHVLIDDDGIHIKAKDGSKVEITEKGIHCTKKDGKPVERDVPMAVIGCVEGLLFLLATVAFILLGSLFNMWYNGWVVFFIPEIICSFARAIRKKNAQQVNVAIIAIFAYFFVCMVIPGLDANLWHPMWVIFFIIPIYHTTISAFHKAIGKSDKDDESEKEDED